MNVGDRVKSTFSGTKQAELDDGTVRPRNIYVGKPGVITNVLLGGQRYKVKMRFQFADNTSIGGVVDFRDREIELDR